MEEIRLTSWYGKYPMIDRVLAPSQVVLAGFLNHQQWNHSQFHLSTVSLETNTFLSHFLQHFSNEEGLMKVRPSSTVPMGWNQILDLPACMTTFAMQINHSWIPVNVYQSHSHGSEVMEVWAQKFHLSSPGFIAPIFHRYFGKSIRLDPRSSW